MPRLAVPALLLAIASVSAPARAQGVVETVELNGVEAYRLEQVLRIVRVRLHQPLRRPPEAIASTLETRYHLDGYPAARVTASYDESSQRLVLAADEGRLAAVRVEGLGPRAAVTAAAAAGLAKGQVLRDSDITDAFDRMETASDGALRTGESRIEPTPEGPRLVLAPAVSRLRLSPLFGGGDLHPVYPWTRVDGFNIPLGAELTLFDLARYDHLRLYAAGFYATSAEKLRYVAGASKPIGPGGRVSVGYEHHDLTDTDDLYRSFDLAGAGGTALYFEPFANYFRRRGDEAYLFARVLPSLEAGVTFRSDVYESLPVATGSSDPNEPVEPGEMRSIVAALRFAPGGLYADPGDERRSHLQRSLFATRGPVRRYVRAEATLEAASPGTLGGDFDFRRFIANVRGGISLGARGGLDARVLFGFSDGDLPLQKRFVLGGVGSLRGYADRAFTGDRLAQTTAEGHLDLGHRLPRLIGFYDGGEVWTDGSGVGWKSSAGAGIQWPARGALFFRADFARALGDPAETKLRSVLRLQVPF